jgi:hypothetical protein
MAQRTRMCVVCKKLIEPERAEGLQQTKLCAAHAEAIKKFGGEFKVIAVQENLSKQNSLKRNPGGVATRMVRNVDAIERLREEFEKQTTGSS